MRTTRWFLSLMAPAMIAASPAAAQTVRYFPPADTTLPFSEAVRVDDMLYLAGQVGVDPATRQLAAGGIRAETRQTMENIRAVLERHGSSLDRVVRCLVMLADMSEWPAMNAVYVTFFPRNLPARSALGANGLALGARVEIECTAVIGEPGG